MATILTPLIRILVAAAGAGSFAVLGLSRGEPVSAAWLLTAAVCFTSLATGSTADSLPPESSPLTPTGRHPPSDSKMAAISFPRTDGSSSVITSRPLRDRGRWSGLRSPRSLDSCPARSGSIIGVVIGGAVQDFVILAASVRRDGKSLGQMAKDEIGPIAGYAALVAVLGIIVILIAVLGLVIVNALKASPWGTGRWH